MSEIVASKNTEQTILAEVTKTRTSLENTLNNAEPNSKPVKVHTSAKKGAKSASHKGHHNHHHQQALAPGAPKPWSSMSVEDLALLVKNQEGDDDEDTIMPSRRRAPVKGATFTSHTVPNSPTMAQPQSQTNTTNATQKTSVAALHSGARTTGNSPVNFFSAPPAPQQASVQKKHVKAAHNGNSTAQKHQFQKQQQQAYQFPLPTFEQSVQLPATPLRNANSATPPSMAQQPSQEFVAAPPQQVVEEPHLVSFYRHDPYAFNVLGENQTVEAAAGSMPAYNGFFLQNTGNQLHNQSYSSENSEGNTSVGYVNSAEVSPVKQQQQQSTSSYLSSPLMQASNSFSSYSVPSTPTTANTPASKKRVYVNGRPVITQ